MREGTKSEPDEIHSEAFPTCGRRRAVDPPATGFDERLAIGLELSLWLKAEIRYRRRPLGLVATKNRTVMQQPSA